MNEDSYKLPTAKEIRDLQLNYYSKLRLHVINEIKEYAKDGYLGVCIEEDKYPASMTKELKEAGYTVEFFGRWAHILWKERSLENLHKECLYKFKRDSCEECSLKCTKYNRLKAELEAENENIREVRTRS